MGCLVSAGAPHSSSVAVVNTLATVMVGLRKNKRFAGGHGKRAASAQRHGKFLMC